MHVFHSLGTSLDWIVMAIYFVGILLFGTYFSKYNRDTNDFFFGGRRFTWWIIAMSIVATGVSSHSFIKYSAKGWEHGFSSTMSYMNDWFFVPFFVFGWLPILIYSKIRSIPEYFERRFSPFARFLVTVLQLLYLVGYVGVGFLTMAKALQPMLPQSFELFGMTFQITIMGIVFVTAIITGTYITFGGQTAVIFTDLVQGIMLLFAGFLVFGLGIAYLGGWGEFWNLLPTSWKLPLANFNNPPDFNFVGVFWQDGIAESIMFLFMNMGILMRFMATKNVNEGRKAATFNTLFMLPLSAIVVGNAGWIGKALSIKFPSLIPATTSPDSIFVVVSSIISRPGVFGFVIAALAAALMSTVSTLLNATAAIWINDVDKPVRLWLKKKDLTYKETEKRNLFNARLATVVFTILGAIAVIPFNFFPTIYEAHSYFQSTITPPLVVAMFFGVFWNRFSAIGLTSTLVGGVVLMILGTYYPLVLQGAFAQGTMPLPKKPPYIYINALYNLIVLMSIGIIVTLLDKQFISVSNKIKSFGNSKPIMISLISLIVVLLLLVFFNVGHLYFLFASSILLTILVAIASAYYIPYDQKEKTRGLTISSIALAKEMFKGSKVNEREGEVIKMHWKLKDVDDGSINFSVADMKRMAAEENDLVYISDKRKWLGGLKSVHSKYGKPHNEDGIVYITKDNLEHGIFVEGKILTAEKEM